MMNPRSRPHGNGSVPVAQESSAIVVVSTIIGTVLNARVMPHSLHSRLRSRPRPARAMMTARATSRTFELSSVVMPCVQDACRITKPVTSMPASGGSPSRATPWPARLERTHSVMRSKTGPPKNPAWTPTDILSCHSRADDGLISRKMQASTTTSSATFTMAMLTALGRCSTTSTVDLALFVGLLLTLRVAVAIARERVSQ